MLQRMTTWTNYASVQQHCIKSNHKNLMASASSPSAALGWTSTLVLFHVSSFQSWVCSCCGSGIRHFCFQTVVQTSYHQTRLQSSPWVNLACRTEEQESIILWRKEVDYWGQQSSLPPCWVLCLNSTSFPIHQDNKSSIALGFQGISDPRNSIPSLHNASPQVLHLGEHIEIWND